MTSRLALFLLSLPALALAQGNLRLTVQLPGGVSFPANGSTVPVQSDGREAVLSVTASNAGLGTITLNQFSVSGPDFSVFGSPGVPLTLRPNEFANFNIRYAPTSRAASAQVLVTATEAGQTASAGFVLSGTAPEYSFAYIAPDGSRAVVSPGARLSFGLTRVNTSQAGTLLVVNSGAAPGVVSQVAIAGRDYVASATAPLTVPAGAEIAIPLTFTPQIRGLSSGTLTVGLGTRAVTFALDGTGAVPEYVAAYVLRADGNVRPLVNNGRLTFAPVAATASDVADVAIVNQGNGPGQVRSVSVAGTGFQLVNLPLLPADIAAGQAVRFGVQFSPRQLGSYTGTLRIELDDRTIVATIEGSTADPSFSLFSVDPVSRNVVALPPGGSLAFAGTPVNTTAVYGIIVRNGGTGTGFVESISLTGEGFQLADLPLLPATVTPSQDLRFSIRFTPRSRDTYRGFLQVQLTSGTLTAEITGFGSAPAFLYEAADPDTQPAPLAPGQELSFSSPVGQPALKVLRFTNNGNAEAIVSAISVSGAGFQLVNPPILPVTIPVNGSQSFTISFTPTQPGRVVGRVQVGTDTINLAGTGLASRLEFAFTNDAGRTAVAENGVIVFPPARVGETSGAEIAVENTGTVALAVSTIDILAAGAVFASDGIPALPFSLEPGASFRFPIRFRPDNTGPLTGSLRINNSQFSLSGVGRPPAAIPDYRLEGPSGVQQPMQQPAVALTLVQPYSLALRGTLTLSFLSDVFVDNPAVQFASGGRTIGFRVPAGATRAIFDNGLTDVRLQTGTVAGSIQLQASVTTTAGLDLTSSAAGPLTLTVPRLRPQLLRAEIVQATTNSVTIAISGYTTTRTLRQADVQITPRAGAKFASTTVSLNVESTSLGWFQSGQSQGFGGLFSLTIPILLQRGNSTENLAAEIQSMSVTVSNELGTSNALTIP